MPEDGETLQPQRPRTARRRCMLEGDETPPSRHSGPTPLGVTAYPRAARCSTLEPQRSPAVWWGLHADSGGRSPFRCCGLAPLGGAACSKAAGCSTLLPQRPRAVWRVACLTVVRGHLLDVAVQAASAGRTRERSPPVREEVGGGRTRGEFEWRHQPTNTGRPLTRDLPFTTELRLAIGSARRRPPCARAPMAPTGPSRVLIPSVPGGVLARPPLVQRGDRPRARAARASASSMSDEGIGVEHV